MSWKDHLENKPKTDLNTGARYSDNFKNTLQGIHKAVTAITNAGFTTYAIEDMKTEMNTAIQENGPLRANTLREGSRDLSSIAADLSQSASVTNNEAHITLTDNQGKVLNNIKHSDLFGIAMATNKKIATLDRQYIVDLEKENNLTPVNRR